MKSSTRSADELFAVPMFVATVFFLAFLAFSIQEFMTRIEFHSPVRMWTFLGLALALYPLFWLEALSHFILNSPRKYFALIACVAPPLRLARRDLQSGTRMWLPILGWRHIDKQLHREVERALSLPMIAVALMILPLLAIDFVWKDQLAASRPLQIVVETGYSITWMAFTMEFIVMFSIVNKKIDYLKTHWVDLLIICLPLIAFLRALRVSQLLRLQHVTKASRLYRMRGLALRAWRGLLALDVISRLMRITPEKRIRALRNILEDKEHEISELKREIERLEAELAVSEQPENTQPTALSEGEAA